MLFYKKAKNAPPPKYSLDKGFTLAEVFSPHCENHHKTAFTLAEVLITLGIIGVVAAMTIPTLIANHRAMVLKTQFKKSYSQLNQALVLLKKDDITIYGNYHGTDIRDLLVKSFQDATLGNYRDYCDNYRNHSKGTAFNTRSLDDGMIITNNGTFIFINNDYGGDYISLYIDINGEKGPNIYGYDLFVFDLNENDKLTVSYPNNTYYCNDTNNNQGNGISCAYFALTDENYFKKLKW